MLYIFYDYQYNEKFSCKITPNITSNIEENRFYCQKFVLLKQSDIIFMIKICTSEFKKPSIIMLTIPVYVNVFKFGD